jgi:hypothetical protein
VHSIKTFLFAIYFSTTERKTTKEEMGMQKKRF